MVRVASSTLAGSPRQPGSADGVGAGLILFPAGLGGVQLLGRSTQEFFARDAPNSDKSYGDLRVLAERLSQVEIYGGKCACQNAEAKTFLAKLRRMIEAIDRGDV